MFDLSLFIPNFKAKILIKCYLVKLNVYEVHTAIDSQFSSLIHKKSTKHCLTHLIFGSFEFSILSRISTIAKIQNYL